MTEPLSPTRPVRTLEEYGLTQGDFDQAVRQASSTVRRRMSQIGATYRTDDVIGTLVGDLWRSLDRWVARGRPPLAAWAHGVADLSVKEWKRRDRPDRGPRRTRILMLDELTDAAPALLGGHANHREPTAQAQEAAELIEALRERVLTLPGGAARWDRLVRNVEHAGRGRRSREALRDLVREVLNLEGPPEPVQRTTHLRTTSRTTEPVRSTVAHEPRATVDRSRLVEPDREPSGPVRSSGPRTVVRPAEPLGQDGGCARGSETTGLLGEPDATARALVEPIETNRGPALRTMSIPHSRRLS